MAQKNKFLREILRLVRLSHWVSVVRFQIQRLITKLSGTTPHHDLSQNIGDIASNAHLICFVIFAPQGIRADTQAVLASLITTKNIKILVILHHEMTDEDQGFLHSLGVNFVQGSNKGWDFGAYRNFCLTLFDQKAPCAQFTLMNDSFVFPLLGTPSDLFPKATVLRPRGLIEQGDRRASKRHLCSFCLTFPGSILQNQAFIRFWRTYRPLTDRHYTIWAGEVALSRALRNAGFDLDVAYPRAKLLSQVEACDDKAISELLPLLFLSGTISKTQAQEAGNLSPNLKRAFVLKHIHNTENLRLSPLFTQMCDMPFVKTRNLRDYPQLAVWYQTHFRGIPDAL